MLQSCPNCSSSEINFLTRTSKKIFSGDWCVYVCRSCMVGFTSPKPKTDIDHYVEASRAIETDQEPVSRKFSLNFVKSFAENLPKDSSTTTKRILDVGCGYGYFLRDAKDFGFQVMGIEPSTFMASHAKSLGIEIFNGSVFEFKAIKDFDIISLLSVAEHIDDIKKLLIFLKENGSNDTIFVFGQAVYDGLVPKVLKGFWYGWSPQEHYWHFTNKSFQKLLSDTGYVVTQTKRTRLSHCFYFGGRWKSLLFNNFVAILDVIAGVFGWGDHVLFYAERKQ